eukprot:TRINITY_DN368_c0_g2_i1.p1 TRINITY_DN368_c0_g2~~TRINITY_DN368_c0_g2_i1.p1  ORF type:complete len:288 (-),score=64.18 TRINITY_DN368_c0_g2_i1:48-911(-)
MTRSKGIAPTTLLRLFIGIVALLLVLFFFASDSKTVLYETEEFDGQKIFVTQCSRKEVCLKFDGPDGMRQSVVRLGDPDHIVLAYTRCLLASLLFIQYLHSVLVIGLGGGSIPHFIRHHYGPAIQIDLVEYYPAIINMQKSQFGFDVKGDPNIKAIASDGLKYAETTKKKYDLIVVDGSALMDASPSSLLLINAMLTPTGVVCFNGFKSGEWNRAKYRNMQQAFNSVYIFRTVSVNEIVIATKSRFFSYDDLIEQARILPFKSNSIDFEKLVSGQDSAESIFVLPPN